jgi:hypothetical protein
MLIKLWPDALAACRAKPYHKAIALMYEIKNKKLAICHLSKNYYSKNCSSTCWSVGTIRSSSLLASAPSSPTKTRSSTWLVRCLWSRKCISIWRAAAWSPHRALFLSRSWEIPNLFTTSD